MTRDCWLAGFGLFLGSCGMATRHAPDQSATGTAGTYEVRICRGPCDQGRPDSSMVTGTLVLEATRYPLSELPASVVSHLEKHDFILTVIDSDRSPNACFVLNRVRQPRTYAGLTKNGVTTWEADSVGTYRFPLYHSPDAGYVVHVTVDGGELRGRGRSWGVGDARVDLPMDSIYGRRVGPPDRGICVRALEAEVTAAG